MGYLKGVAQINPQQGGRFHQTSKPIDLMNKIIEIVEPNSVILDPFMGSGSTGVAAATHHHGFVGVEVTKNYYDVAQSRINEAAQKHQP